MQKSEKTVVFHNCKAEQKNGVKFLCFVFDQSKFVSSLIHSNLFSLPFFKENTNNSWMCIYNSGGPLVEPNHIKKKSYITPLKGGMSCQDYFLAWRYRNCHYSEAAKQSKKSHHFII